LAERRSPIVGFYKFQYTECKIHNAPKHQSGPNWTVKNSITKKKQYCSLKWRRKPSGFWCIYNRHYWNLKLIVMPTSPCRCGGFGNPESTTYLSHIFWTPTVIGPNYSHFAEATALSHNGCISVSTKQNWLRKDLIVDDIEVKRSYLQHFVQMNKGATNIIMKTREIKYLDWALFLI
jgi:hypothetical protein